MSIFSSIRRAKEHNAKVAEQRKKQEKLAEAPRVPYRHIPTHAATDAFASAPPSWREAADRPKIIEQNLLRNARSSNTLRTMPSMPSMHRMPSMASMHRMPSTGSMNSNYHNIPHTGSTWSFVTYSGQNTPAVGRPYMDYSYTNSMPYFDQARDSIYTHPDMQPEMPPIPPAFGDRVLRADSTRRPPPRPLPFARDTDNSSDTSSDYGSSQEDGFEMKPLERRPSSQSVSIQRPHRLHPSSRTRDPSPASSSSGYLSLRNSRDSLAPPSIKGFTIIHAATQSAGAIDSPTVSEPAACVVVPETNSRCSVDRPLYGSVQSRSSLSARTSRESFSSRSTSPVPQETTQTSAFPQRSSSLYRHRSSASTAYESDEAALLAAQEQPQRRPSRPPRPPPFRTMERIQSMAEEPYVDYSHLKAVAARLPVARVEVINYLPKPEAVSSFDLSESPPRSKSRLSKRGSKLQKRRPSVGTAF